MPTATPTVTSTPSPTVTPTPIPTATPTPTVTATPTPLVEITRGSSSRSYYQQSAEIHGVSIKAARRVSSKTLHIVAQVVNLMLDGRADIKECIARHDSVFAVLQKGHNYWDLPGFRYIWFPEDIWGRSYDELHGWGAIPTRPTTMVSESALLGETNYRPYDVAIHEFAHSIMNLCFDHATMQKLDALYRGAVKARLGFGIDIMLDRSEFFAEFSSIYFDAHTDVPRQALVEKLPDLLEFLEKIYGEVTVHDSARPGFVRYTTQSGIPVPWEAASTASYEDPTRGVFEDPDLRYSIEIPEEWELAAQEADSVLWKRVVGGVVTGSFSVDIWKLPTYEFARGSDILAEFEDTWQNDYESRHADWDEFERLLSQRIKFNGIDWVTSRYNGVASPDHCPVAIRSQIGVITHLDNYHRVDMRMSLCKGETLFETEWFRLMQSFEAAASDLK